MRRIGSATALLTALAIAVAGCGSGDAADGTVSAPTTAPRNTIDARLDPGEIVISDEDLDGDGLPTTVAPDAADTSVADTADTGDVAPDAGGDTDPSDGAVDGGPDDADATTDPGDLDDVGFTTAEEIPDGWPDDVPAPAGLTDIAATVFEDSIEYTIVVTGIPASDPTTYVAGYLDEVRTAGFEPTSVIEEGVQVYSFVAERDGWFLSGASTSVGGTEEIVIALTRDS